MIQRKLLFLLWNARSLTLQRKSNAPARKRGEGALLHSLLENAKHSWRESLMLGSGTDRVAGMVAALPLH